MVAAIVCIATIVTTPRSYFVAAYRLCTAYTIAPVSALSTLFLLLLTIPPFISTVLSRALRPFYLVIPSTPVTQTTFIFPFSLPPPPPYSLFTLPLPAATQGRVAQSDSGCHRKRYHMETSNNRQWRRAR